MTTYYIIAVAVTTAHIPNVLFEASSPDEACELVRSAPQSKGRATDQQLIDACRASRALLRQRDPITAVQFTDKGSPILYVQAAY
jgi:hypothetical protein